MNNLNKLSKQGSTILKELKGRCDHPTASNVWEDLNSKGYDIGIATVYRNLQKLSENGEILRIKTENGIDRFDGNIIPHIHFECKKCGKVYDIFLEENDNQILNNFFSELTKKIGASEENTEAKINGLCKNCK